MASMSMILSPLQNEVIHLPYVGSSYLHGNAGTGKTTAASLRLVQMLKAGIPAESILVLAPQRTLLTPYLDAVADGDEGNPGNVTSITLGGLARRMTDLFWPIVAAQGGFANPENPPIFLTLETTEYYIAQITAPLLDQGFFSSIVIDRNRLYSQLIDNLNKAAIGCYSHLEIADRLKSAWNGDRNQFRVYDNAQFCATEFRQYCLANNLLDYSLQITLFYDVIWQNPVCRQYLLKSFPHLIVENVDEDTTFTHQILDEWLPETESALLVFDTNGGFRPLLGANPKTGARLIERCSRELNFTESFVSSSEIQWLETALISRINHKEQVRPLMDFTLTDILEFDFKRFFPEMIDWTAERIADLIQQQNIPPSEIAVLAPFLSDSLRFSLSQALGKYGIRSHSLRPSRSLVDEPVTQSLLTLAMISHLDWGRFSSQFIPGKFDIAYALTQVLDGCDLIRAQIMAEELFRVSDSQIHLFPFEDIPGNIQNRITFRLGQQYEVLRNWILDYQNQPPEMLDHYLSRLFGEVLSQPDFGFHRNLSAGEITANLMESIYKFRRSLVSENDAVSLEYVRTAKSGVLAAQYLRSWTMSDDESVLIAPAYTFLTVNKPVDYQFWLDIGSHSWSERIFQPVTHPYVLSKDWPIGKLWTDEEEIVHSLDALQRLILGLLRRCRKKVFLGLSNLGEQGYEQRGPLLQAFQAVLRDQIS